MKQHFLQLLNYEYWANNLVFELVKNNPAGNSRIIEILNHIFEAQRIWISRINAEGYSSSLFAVVPLSQVEKLKEDAQTLWKKSLEEIIDMDEMISYRNTKGDLFSTSYKDIVTHVINHSTHHRAEIITLLRAEINDLSIPPTDYIFYLRATSK